MFYTTTMNMNENIKIACVKRNISIAELARRSGQTPQNFNQKMRINNFKTEELEKIADALDCDLEIRLIDKDTKEVLV